MVFFYSVILGVLIFFFSSKNPIRFNRKATLYWTDDGNVTTDWMIFYYIELLFQTAFAWLRCLHVYIFSYIYYYYIYLDTHLYIYTLVETVFFFYSVDVYIERYSHNIKTTVEEQLFKNDNIFLLFPRIALASQQLYL